MASGREKDASLAEEVVISGLEKETTTAVRSTPKRLAVQDPTAALSTCATQVSLFMSAMNQAPTTLSKRHSHLRLYIFIFSILITTICRLIALG